MKSRSIGFRASLIAIPLLVLVWASNARADVVIYPPAAFVATFTPEYFDGRPVYWYNNHWFYRDHGRWAYYRSEPTFLRDRRAHWGHARVGRYDDRRYRYRH